VFDSAIQICLSRETMMVRERHLEQGMVAIIQALNGKPSIGVVTNGEQTLK
jgi:hypothetical protein